MSGWVNGLLRYGTMLLAALLIVACGGGGGSKGSGGGGGDGGDPVVQTGVLLDAAVAGVRFESTPSERSGVTNAEGEFEYVEGDVVEFSVGSISLGAVPAKGVVTPVDIANAYPDLPSGVTAQDVARNIAIFLQSFDADGNPDNGITISEAVVEAAAVIVDLDFKQKPEEFVTQPALVALADETGAIIVEPGEAGEHFARTLEIFMSGTWRLENDSGSELALLSFFPGGRYLLGIQHVDENCGNGLEFGTYELDADNMVLSVTGVSVDTTGGEEDITDCGLHENGEGVTVGLEIVSAEHFQAVFEEYGEEVRLDFRKLVNDGFSGSWSFIDEPNSGLLAFLPDGRYMQIQVSDVNNAPGIEVGTWSVDANGALSATQEIDTNGDAGLSHAFDVVLLIDNWRRLAATVHDDDDTLFPSHPYRLNLAGNTASSVITASGCPGATGGWAYTFDTDEMTWTGTDTFVTDHGAGTCAAGGTETMTVRYSQKDAPFACGGPVCGYYDLNKVIEGVDEDGRAYVSSYAHVPGSDTVTYVKETAEDTVEEVITLH